MQLDLLRHGETEQGHTLRGSTNDALTAQGWQAMQHTIDQALPTWQVIFSSPLQRCAHFAQALAQALDLPCYCLNQLQEMHFGEWEGKTTQHLYECYPTQLAQFWQTPTQFTPPQAESIQDFATRIDEGMQNIQQIMQQHQFTHALVVTHGGVIKYLKCKALAQPLDLILAMPAELAQLHHFSCADGQIEHIV